jgi:hypothetical protein
VNRHAVALALVFSLCALGCASTTKESQSIRQVDDLLTRVERAQVESLVGKEKSNAALASLETLLQPGFGGDAAVSYAELVKSIDQSESQAKVFASCIAPMHGAGERVFDQWAADLESFGSSRMRQRSQARLEETRMRFLALLTAAKSAQLAYDALNADLRDHALFLGHDLNAHAIAAIAPDVVALRERCAELSERFDACAAAARAYVEAAALHGELAAPPAPAAAEPAPRSTSALRGAQPPPAVKPAPAPAPAPQGSLLETFETEAPEAPAPN